MKAAGIARAHAYGVIVGICPCSFTEESVGAAINALVAEDCGEHIPGCAYVAKYGEGSAAEVIP